MLANNLVENIPNLGLFFFDQLLGLLDGSRKAFGIEPRINERLEQLECHLFRQTALMQLELGADHDDVATRIVDAFAEQVLPEATLLAFEHIGKRLEWPFVGAGDDATTTTVVEQRVNSLLEHPLLIA